MPLGYDGKLYILAFDHRGSFQKGLFGIEGKPTPQQTARIIDAKALIFEGMLEAVARGAERGATGVLIDEQFGGDVPARAHAAGLRLAMPVERSGQREFDFEYGDDFPAHIEQHNPDFVKVLVRFNPEDDAELNERQLTRLRRLSSWLHEHDRKFLFELLVPATEAQLQSVGGSSERYDTELRPELMRRTIETMQGHGVEVDIWKIEGVDASSDAELLSRQARAGASREQVKCVLLGRGASREKVEQWLGVAAPVEGFIGFAIGRSTWSDALRSFLSGTLERAEAVSLVADNYLHFVEVYESAGALSGQRV